MRLDLLYLPDEVTMFVCFYFTLAIFFVKIWLNYRYDYILHYLFVRNEADDFKLAEPLPDTLNSVKSGLAQTRSIHFQEEETSLYRFKRDLK